MEKILNQEEIDQLFRAARGAAVKAQPAKKRAVLECDFRQAGQLGKDQVQQVTLPRTIRDYAVKLNADELILARPRRFLWVRLRASGRSWDLLFRLPAGKIAERAAMSRWLRRVAIPRSFAAKAPHLLAPKSPPRPPSSI